MSDDDRELAARFLARGDEAAFRRLYAAHTPRLYLSLLRLCGGREAEAEELLQEAWIRAASALAFFRWESALATWLHGIALNAWREAARARRAQGVALDELPEEPSDHGAESDGRESAVDLERAVRELPEGYREVLVLHDIEGYSHEEISELLTIAPGTSKSQLARARGRLRNRLAGAPVAPTKEDVQ